MLFRGQAADVLVTKAGPGTIAEAAACGLPVMLYAFLAGQVRIPATQPRERRGRP
jgi:UDP-N-acetylglucosamine:LPS N-acetylglucosamine transferase